ncbi:hypothetical protein [Halothiobacillus sp. DCM-1]|uniref:hypothetical protein n=1 Tax=Halothiobacillus sp. DCM-1 TaxID=3112558 RepID=UPI0032474A6A
MMRRIVKLGLLFSLGMNFSSGYADEPAAAGRLAVGAAFPTVAVTDQHDKPVGLPGAAKVIIYANSKAADEWVNPVLAQYGAEALRAHQVAYVSDISRMPGLISRMIALPQLRERSYPVVLLRESAQLLGMPQPPENCVDWVALQAGRVTELTPLCTAAQVSERLNALP